MRKESKTSLQRKCDRVLQEIGREVYDKCLVCGGEYSCLHHFVFKSQSTALRFYWKNLVPICHKCHFSIHSCKNDLAVGKIASTLGPDWIADLERTKKAGAGKNYGITWYREKLEELKGLKDKVSQ